MTSTDREWRERIAQLPEPDRRRLLTLDAAIRFAETTAKVAKDATRRFAAAERAAQLRREETRVLLDIASRLPASGLALWQSRTDNA